MIFYFIIEDLFRILRFSFYRIFFILSHYGKIITPQGLPVLAGGLPLYPFPV